MDRESVKALSEDDIRLCHNEFIRRYRHKNRGAWNATRREMYKRTHTNKDSINNTKDKILYY